MGIRIQRIIEESAEGTPTGRDAVLGDRRMSREDWTASCTIPDCCPFSSRCCVAFRKMEEEAIYSDGDTRLIRMKMLIVLATVSERVSHESSPSSTPSNAKTSESSTRTRSVSVKFWTRSRYQHMGGYGKRRIEDCISTEEIWNRRNTLQYMLATPDPPNRGQN